MPVRDQLTAIDIGEIADGRKGVERQAGGARETGLRNELRRRQDSDNRRDRRSKYSPSRRQHGSPRSVRLQADLRSGPGDQECRTVRDTGYDEQQRQVLNPERRVEEQAGRDQQRPAVAVRGQVVDGDENREEREEPERIKQHVIR